MKEHSAIEARNLVKKYEIKKDGRKTSFKALDHLNLEIPKGKVTGIIGSNGAGKSTLLKVLSRITYPTSGEVLVKGTLSSLLEVGTGFHPELSGRENIFLNGSILGMSHREIKERFDAIVDFSGIGDFIDTPVKHYSSGMYVRLAFSVAANLTPDILLIDEVLAVGDAAFQKKCLHRMGEARHQEGRTVVFVSHNMSAIRQLCDDVIWLKSGQMHQYGPADEIVANYLKELESYSRTIPIAERTDRQGSGDALFTRLEWQSDRDLLISGKPAKVSLHYRSTKMKMISALNFRLNVFKEDGDFITCLSNEMHAQPINRAPEEASVECFFDRLPFFPGNYYITATLYVNGVESDKVENALSFSVEEGDDYHSGAPRTLRRAGARVNQSWQLLS